MIWAALELAPALRPAPALVRKIGVVVCLPPQHCRGRLVYGYVRATRSKLERLPRSAYAHDASGARVRDAVHPFLYVMDPRSSAWRANVAARCARYEAHWAHGCFFDAIGGRRRTTSPVTIGTAAWWRGVAGLLDAAPGRVVANNVCPVSAWDAYKHVVYGHAAAYGCEGWRPVAGDVRLERHLHVWVTASPGARGAFMLHAGRGDRFGTAPDPLAVLG